MKAVWRILIPILALALLFLLPGPGFAAEKSLADILKEKGVISEEEYQQVKQMEEAQKAQEAKKAEEAAKKAEEATKEAVKKAAAEKPAGLPPVGYNKGFFLQSPDGKFKLVNNGVRPDPPGALPEQYLPG